jgi:hypothetical protein
VEDKNSESHLPIDKVSKDEAERRKAIQAVRKAELQVDTLKGKLLPKDVVDADRTMQAIIHIMHLRKQERLLPGILAGLTKNQIKQQISNFNKYEIDKWREELRYLNDDPAQIAVLTLVLHEITTSADREDLLIKLLGKQRYKKLILDPNAAISDDDQRHLRGLGFSAATLKRVTDSSKY